MTLQVIVKRICERKLESSMTKSLSEKNDTFGSVWKWTSPSLIMPSLFSSVASRGRGISAR